MEAIVHKETLQTSSPWIFFYFKFDEILPKLCHFLAILPTLCSICAHALDSQWAVTVTIFMKYIPESYALSITELNVEVFILQSNYAHFWWV